MKGGVSFGGDVWMIPIEREESPQAFMGRDLEVFDEPSKVNKAHCSTTTRREILSYCDS